MRDWSYDGNLYIFDEQEIYYLENSLSILSSLMVTVDDWIVGGHGKNPAFSRYESICGNMTTNEIFYPYVTGADCNRFCVYDIFVRSWLAMDHDDNLPRSSIYPVGGKVQFNDEMRKDIFWNNPKRIEYLQYLINCVTMCVQTKEIKWNEFD